jgi:hypothetical protein
VSILLIDFTVSSRGDERERRGSKTITFQGAIMTSHETRASGYRRQAPGHDKAGSLPCLWFRHVGPNPRTENTARKKTWTIAVTDSQHGQKNPAFISFFWWMNKRFPPFSKIFLSRFFLVVLLLAGVRCTVQECNVTWIVDLGA